MSKTRQNARSTEDRLRKLESDAAATRHDIEVVRDKLSEIRRQLAPPPDYPATIDAAIGQFSGRLNELERRLGSGMISALTRAEVAKIMREESRAQRENEE